MTWLVVASVGLIAKVGRETKKKTALWACGLLLFYGALIALFWLEAGERAFRGSETGLIGWFIIGPALFLVSELLLVLRTETNGWALAAQGLAAGAFALGFDLFRPDDYSFVPGAILVALILVVAMQAYLRMSAGMKNSGSSFRVLLALYVVSIAGLVYASAAKVIDRGWALPVAYAAGAGALLFAAGQVWMGWEMVQKKKIVAPWVRAAAINLGQLLMVVAAFFVYNEFL